ncbi:MAG TPA: maleylpyruvate isomerase family mycothiol-dependent enzyme [Dermatophilaceae bacterium]|nr:maleylpyruvate isomerase family mycothiol-dependent enzyme [Dermatophilaceae bacterium]
MVAERQALAGILRTLSDDDWAQPSLCSGWTVKDVAAHVISSPQFGPLETAKLLPSVWRGYNTMILRDGQPRGRAPVDQILADYERWASVRRGPVTVTHIEPLVDVLVHTQDIVRPLGRRYAMPTAAAAVAAERCRLLSRLLGSHRLVIGVRMSATDIDCARTGAHRRSPHRRTAHAVAGRPAEASALSGDGLALLRSS